MPIYDNDGTANREIGKLYDYNGSANTQIGKVYDNDGTTNRLIYSAQSNSTNVAASTDNGDAYSGIVTNTGGYSKVVIERVESWGGNYGTNQAWFYVGGNAAIPQAINFKNYSRLTLKLALNNGSGINAYWYGQAHNVGYDSWDQYGRYAQIGVTSNILSTSTNIWNTKPNFVKSYIKNSGYRAPLDTTITLDVSGLTGNGYISAYTYFADGAYTCWRITDIILT